MRSTSERRESAMNGIGAVSSISRIGLGAAGGATPVGGTGSVGSAGSAGATSAVDGSNGGQAPGSSFFDTLGDAFGQLNGQLTAADAAGADFAAGGSADVHTVMLQMEEASISLKMGVQVRDKLLEAYQEIMRTQL